MQFIVLHLHYYISINQSLLSNPPSRKQFSNLRPPVPQNGVGFVDDEVFFIAPGALFDQWIKVVDPAITTLSCYPPLQLFGNQRPLSGAIFPHQLYNLSS